MSKKNEISLMSFKLIMLRKINELTEENLAKQLNIDTKTIAE